MDRVGVRELRQDASQVLRRVAAGETVTITDRGRPVARLSPIAPSAGVAELRAAGLVREPARRMRDAPDPVAPPRGARSASQALAAARDHER
jgi:prevent-host-death family protein